MITEKRKSYFSGDTIYISEKRTAGEVFKEVALDLQSKGLVKEAFLENLLIREKEFPTGMDLSVIDPALPNIAIPHTESSFVNCTGIVPIKLTHPISFQNMIKPDEQVNASFLFMILNENGAQQTGMLADIMDFINRTPKDSLIDFFNQTNTKEIADYLEKNFKGENKND